MSTKNQTTSTAQFNPLSMQTYGQLLPQASNALSQEISNPYNNMFFNQQLGMMNQQIGAQGSSAQSAINQSLQARGLQGNSPLAAYMGRMGANQTQAAQAQGYNSLLLNAANLRQQAIGGAMSYQPLQTGTTNVQQQTGLGTWLPQVLGAGIGLAGMGMGAAGGAPGGLGASMSAATNNSLLAPGGLANNFNPGQGYNPGSFGNSFMPGQGY